MPARRIRPGSGRLGDGRAQARRAVLGRGASTTTAAKVHRVLRAALAAAVAGAGGVREHVEAIVHGGFLPDALAAHDAFGRRVAELVEAIVADGVRAAAADACRGRLARIP